MDIKNFLVAFFVIVIVLTLISLIPSENQTGHFIMPSIVSLAAILIILFSFFAIAAILSKKIYFPY